jgi:hypothetical protein
MIVLVTAEAPVGPLYVRPFISLLLVGTRGNIVVTHYRAHEKGQQCIDHCRLTGSILADQQRGCTAWSDGMHITLAAVEGAPVVEL